jgi:hypothetical protein
VTDATSAEALGFSEEVFRRFRGRTVQFCTSPLKNMNDFGLGDDSWAAHLPAEGIPERADR